MKKILLTGAFKYSKDQLSEIERLGFKILYVQDERIPLNFDVSDIAVVVCNNLFTYNDIRDFEEIEVIQLTSTGLDRLPVDYINKKNIKVFNAKGIYNIPMAEWVILKILEIYKKSKFFYQNQEQHKWEKHRDLLELTDRVAAIIGFGSVGYEVAKRLKAFDVRVIGVGRRKIESDLLDEYYLIEDIDEVLNKSDIVILTLPLTEETKHLIDRDKIKHMKDNCVLVNVSRGGVIDEADLIEAIRYGKFLGVALDVFEEEPISKYNLLWDLDNVIITPHNSFVSDKVNERLFECIEANLRLILKI